MTRDRFEYLFELYKAGRLSIKDREELRTAFREGAYDEELQKDFMQLLQQEEVHDSWTPELESEMWRQIQKGRRSAEDSTGGAISYRRLLRYTAIAASLFFCIALAWWFKSSSSHPAKSRAASHVRSRQQLLRC